jgi:hypothetical protein
VAGQRSRVEAAWGGRGLASTHGSRVFEGVGCEAPASGAASRDAGEGHVRGGTRVWAWVLRAARRSARESSALPAAEAARPLFKPLQGSDQRF